MPSQPAEENGLQVKRRRVTREMEGKYIINMPKGTTARTQRILEQQAEKCTLTFYTCVSYDIALGIALMELDVIDMPFHFIATAKVLKRTSVFDRLGAESKADTTTTNKVISILLIR